jgi:hypothetical protein
MRVARIPLLVPVIVLLSACGPGDDVQVRTQVGEISVQGREFATYADFVEGFLQRPCDALVAPYDNEMHDCQRLVRTVAGQREFGPLAGIIPDSAAVAQPEAAYEQEPIRVAWVTNAGALSGGDEYEPLGLVGPPEDAGGQPEGRCLWLRSSNEVWQAALTPLIRTGASDCETPDAQNGDWSRLRVERQTYGQAPIEDYPNTARWDWTGGPPDFDGEHYIGVKCGAGWCAVGDTAFRPRPIPQPDQQPDRRRAIPGWHDAQLLAVWERTPGNPNDSTLVPGPWGVIYPWAIPADPAWETGVVVAQIELTPVAGGGIGAYARKFRAGASPGQTARSLIEMFYDPDRSPEPDAFYIGNGRRGARGVVVGHALHGPAQSARWQWHEEDETAWVPCPRRGCCDVQEAF